MSYRIISYHIFDYQILVSIFVPTFEHLNFLKRSFDPKGPHQFSSHLKWSHLNINYNRTWKRENVLVPLLVSYRIISYRIVSYRIISYRIISYGMVWYGIVSYIVPLKRIAKSSPQFPRAGFRASWWCDSHVISTQEGRGTLEKLFDLLFHVYYNCSLWKRSRSLFSRWSSGPQRERRYLLSQAATIGNYYTVLQSFLISFLYILTKAK